MPQVVPMVPESTITLQANTQMPSARVVQQQAPVTPAQQEAKTEVPAPAAPTTEQDSLLLRHRLAQEKTKRQLELRAKELEKKERELEAKLANSRKYLEAEEFAQRGDQIQAAAKLGLDYNKWYQDSDHFLLEIMFDKN